MKKHMDMKFNLDLIQRYRTSYSDTYYQYPNDFVLDLFTSEIGDVSEHINSDRIRLAEIDKTNTYNRNSLGYREKEFSNNAELIFAGCSHTYGIGVPEETIWGNLIAEKFSTKANLALPGMSTEWIVKNIINFIDIYGPPKVLMCLFPDFGRMQMPINPYIVKKKSSEINEHFHVLHTHFYNHRDGAVELYPKYSKRPHAIEEVMPLELPMYTSMQAIHMLIKYCKQLNIKFLWSVWEEDIHQFLLENKEIFNLTGFVDVKLSNWHAHEQDQYQEIYHDTKVISDKCKNNRTTCTGSVDCHSELLEKYKDNFYMGSDKEKGPQHAHFGIHKHAHIAEEFLKTLENSN